MNKIDNEIYKLLPAYYLIQDNLQGEPLKALFDVIAREAGVMEDDIRQLYENWFIETCDEWVVPYIGDLLGISGSRMFSPISGMSQRSFVANTLAYRRRKGTVPVLEQLAHDITGWRSHVVEFFEILETTQNINHKRYYNSRTPDLRNCSNLGLLNTAFDRISHTVDVRPISSGEGWHNIHNIGIFLWRLQSYHMNKAVAWAESGNTGNYRFSQLGLDISLFNKPKPEKEITHLAGEINVPGILRCQPLYYELLNIYAGSHSGSGDFYFDTNREACAFEIFDACDPSNVVRIPFEDILICDLEHWEPKVSDELSHLIDCSQFRLAVDPVNGRIKALNGTDFDDLIVSYAYGFSGDVGGGPYNRKESIPEIFFSKNVWQAGVSQNASSLNGELICRSVKEAVIEWNKLKTPSLGIITIMDSFTYNDDISIIIPEGSQLLLVAAGWPVYQIQGDLSGAMRRIQGKFTPDELRPHIRGNMEIVGAGPVQSINGGMLFLNGLLLEGKVEIKPGNLGILGISHCTIVPGTDAKIEMKGENKNLEIHLFRSIAGQILVDSQISSLFLEDSIITSNILSENLTTGVENMRAILADSTPAEIQRSTIFGSVSVQQLIAGNSIFNNTLKIARCQEGCIRFCYLPAESKTPRRFRCQPDLEINSRIADNTTQGKIAVRLRKKIRDQIIPWMFPQYTSVFYGDHGFSQLAFSCPDQIKTGAEDGSEMGVFSFLKQPQREKSLLVALDEYLNVGLKAGLKYAT